MNKLSSVSLLLLIIALCAVWYYRADAIEARKSLAVYQGNNEVLIRRLKKTYADKLETDKRNEELEKAAEEDKSDFDWHYDISRNPVIMRLQAR